MADFIRSCCGLGFASLLSVTSLGACNDAPPPAAPTGPARAPEFADRTKRADYDRGLVLLGEMKALAGSDMTLELATKLGYKCADLRGVQNSLAKESDPLVERVRYDIDKWCGLDVPLASAQLEVALIEEKRKTSGEGVDVKHECRSLKLALGDIGARFTSNPDVVDVGGKYAQYCPY